MYISTYAVRLNLPSGILCTAIFSFWTKLQDLLSSKAQHVISLQRFLSVSLDYICPWWSGYYASACQSYHQHCQSQVCLPNLFGADQDLFVSILIVIDFCSQKTVHLDRFLLSKDSAPLVVIFVCFNKATIGRWSDMSSSNMAD